MTQSTHTEIQRLQAKLQSIGQQRRRTRQPTTTLHLAGTPTLGTAPDAATEKAVMGVEAGAATVTTVNRVSQNQALQLVSLPFGTLPSYHPKPLGATASSPQAPPSPTDAPVLSPEDARQLAQALRRRQQSSLTAKAPGIQTGSAYLLQFGKRLGRSLGAPLGAQTASASREVTDTSHSSSQSQPIDALTDITLQDAILWIGASAAARVGLDLLLMTYTSLWWPVVALIVAPAAIALYRAAVAPKAGFVLGRQLLLIMIGLLIGGRVL
ncbi:MAG: hypothetical protein WBA10_00195 [Elainellaceae cyanobacterium]